MPVDPDFRALPLREFADVALGRATDFGVTHAEFRFERLHSQYLQSRDGVLIGSSEREVQGFSVRVLLNGVLGFAAGVLPTKSEAVRVAENAVHVAQTVAPIAKRATHWAAEPVYPDVEWSAPHEIDPFAVATAEKSDLLNSWTAQLGAASGVEHAAASAYLVKECKYYADTAGTHTTQQRIRVEPYVEAFGSDESRGIFDSMRTIAPPAGRGWEHFLGSTFDFDAERAQLPDLLAEKLRAPSVRPGPHDLVIHPSNLWLTIHESVGHATELDRALGFEANYAGSSFATPDLLGTLRYGSPLMQITGDRTTPHGLATVGYDDEGVAAQSWDIVRDGILVGYQLDRPMAHGSELNGGRSNGCAYADSPGHVPIQRMANVSLQADPAGPDLDALISDVDEGILVVGDKSWSIDMQRHNFQFTGQRFHRIRGGKLAGQVRDVAYQATTTDFWNALRALGGPSTYELGGAMNCGKAQPGQVAAVSHGCPAAVFSQINILNAVEEAG